MGDGFWLLASGRRGLAILDCGGKTLDWTAGPRRCVVETAPTEAESATGRPLEGVADGDGDGGDGGGGGGVHAPLADFVGDLKTLVSVLQPVRRKSLDSWPTPTDSKSATGRPMEDVDVWLTVTTTTTAKAMAMAMASMNAQAASAPSVAFTSTRRWRSFVGPAEDGFVSALFLPAGRNSQDFFDAAWLWPRS